jgi:hypothetical protein
MPALEAEGQGIGRRSTGVAVTRRDAVRPCGAAGQGGARAQLSTFTTELIMLLRRQKCFVACVLTVLIS